MTDPLMEGDRSAPPIRHTVLAVLSIVFVGVASHAVGSMKPVVIEAYIHSINLSPSVAGYLLTSEMVSTSLGTIVAALGGNVVRSRQFLFIALASVLLANVVSYAIQATGETLFLLRFLAGFGAGVGLGRLGVAIAFSSQPNRVAGIYSVATMAFGSFAAFSIPSLRHVWGDWVLFLFLAASLPAALILIRWFPISIDGRQDVRSDVLSTGSRSVIVAALSLYYIAIGAYWPFAGEIGRKAGLSYHMVSAVLGFAAIAGLVGSGVSVLFGDRRDANGLMRGLFAAQSLSILLPVLSPASQELFRFSACLFAFSWFALFPFLMGMMSRLDPSGRLNGLLYVVAAAAFAAGPGAAGWLIGHDRAEDGGLLKLQWFSLVSMLISTAALACIGHRARQSAKSSVSLKD
jgi:MFS family permease